MVSQGQNEETYMRFETHEVCLFVRATFWKYWWKVADLQRPKLLTNVSELNTWGWTPNVTNCWPTLVSHNSVLISLWSASYGVSIVWPSDTIWWQRSRSTLAQVMACCLTAPSHHLNQCWLIISHPTCWTLSSALKHCNCLPTHVWSQPDQWDIGVPTVHIFKKKQRPCYSDARLYFVRLDEYVNLLTRVPFSPHCMVAVWSRVLHGVCAADGLPQTQMRPPGGPPPPQEAVASPYSSKNQGNSVVYSSQGKGREDPKIIEIKKNIKTRQRKKMEKIKLAWWSSVKDLSISLV